VAVPVILLVIEQVAEGAPCPPLLARVGSIRRWIGRPWGNGLSSGGRARPAV